MSAAPASATEVAAAGPVARFDATLERGIARLRGTPALDRVFYGLSELGNFSLVWYLLGTARALQAERPLRELARLTTVITAESILVNQGVKRLFARERPSDDGDHPHRLRRPLTSSFPSGHATAAFTAASVLAEGSRCGPAYFALAGLVASSRVYVRSHHPSDVVAGALIGVGLGAMARRVWPADGAAPGDRRCA